MTRHWVRTRIGPYVVITTEVRPSAYETSVTWGEEGPEVDYFGAGLALNLVDAKALHERICDRVEGEVGVLRAFAHQPPVA